ncbi:hypothetical protein [Streptococcus cristatus]|uniref:Uncharacterized protein n=1 Tax=Streptococcus cristatus TaxID=45634 RepID=A0A139MX53_STRCR|nr:hypothetical protein [Streptococcus cristatus]KXT68366.1 hypothetical protein SCRDD08_02050 [Streptococcus cristatus]
MNTLMMKRMASHLSKKELFNQDGSLLARYIRLPGVFPEDPGGIYLENPTERRQMYRVCKNGKPILFPIIEAGMDKIIYFEDYQHVHPGDHITVTEHLEEYVYDGTECD